MGLKLLEQKKITELVLIRSAVESADNRLGFLKGELSAKFEPYLTPFYEKFDELIDPATLAKLEKDERIHFIPNNFLRGTQFSVKFVFCDEAQNLSVKEHLTLLSRIGEFSKVIIGGDTDQCDIPINKSGFLKVYDSFNNEESEKHGIYCFEFGPEDNMRSDVSKYVTQKFKEIH
jgi:phosphate starvation-inducible PhoH-like protein